MSLTISQQIALDVIRDDGGMMKHHRNGATRYFTLRGFMIHYKVAKSLIERGHLIANNDGEFGDTQTYRIAS